MSEEKDVEIIMRWLAALTDVAAARDVDGEHARLLARQFRQKAVTCTPEELRSHVSVAFNRGYERGYEVALGHAAKPKARKYVGGWMSHCDSCEVNERPIARMRCPDCEARLGKHADDEHGLECGCPECVGITSHVDRSAKATATARQCETPECEAHAPPPYRFCAACDERRTNEASLDAKARTVRQAEVDGKPYVCGCDYETIVRRGEDRVDAQNEASPETIELPLYPNEDTEITCIYCRRELRCEYGLVIKRDDERAFVGLHASCLDRLRDRNPRRESPKHPVTGEDYEAIFRQVRDEKDRLRKKNHELHERAQRAEVERDALRKVAEAASAWRRTRGSTLETWTNDPEGRHLAIEVDRWMAKAPTGGAK